MKTLHKSPKSLSFFLNDSTPAYGGVKGAIKVDQITSIRNGDTANNSRIIFNNHIGTHIDFPFHFSENGKKSSDYSESFWIFNNVGFINCQINQVENEIQKLDIDIEILILKTGFGSKRGEVDYWKNQPVIPSNFAYIFKNKFPKLRVFGFDMISLTSKLNRDEGKKAHIDFLIKNDILILEDMNLSKLTKSPEKIIISPFLVDNIDGIPCNVIAF